LIFILAVYVESSMASIAENWISSC
jgi:hypothetical protein